MCACVCVCVRACVFVCVCMCARPLHKFTPKQTLMEKLPNHTGLHNHTHCCWGVHGFGGYWRPLRAVLNQPIAFFVTKDSTAPE